MGRSLCVHIHLTALFPPGRWRLQGLCIFARALARLRYMPSRPWRQAFRQRVVHLVTAAAQQEAGAAGAGAAPAQGTSRAAITHREAATLQRALAAFGLKPVPELERLAG